MTLKQTVSRTSTGLYTHFNAINAAPEGAMLVAENAVADRPGVIGNRRGFNRYGTALSAPATEIFEYLDTIVLLDGTSLKYDSDSAGTWSAWTGSFTKPDSSTPMRSVESNNNFYFTTSKGLYKNDSLTGTPERAGIPYGLDTTVTVSGTGDSWFTPDSRVGYRIMWGREDANNNTILGRPSPRSDVTNALSAMTASWSGGISVITQASHGYTTSDSVVMSGTSETYDGTFTISVIDTDTFTYSLSTAPSTISDKAGFSGKAFDSSVTFTVPDDIAAGDFYEIYRTDLSADALTSPGDELKKLVRNDVVAGDISTGTITYVDTFDSAFLGERLYTNQTQEGASQTNDRPPWCKYIVEWKGHSWYFNTKREHELEVQLISASTNFDTFTMTVTDGTNSLAVIFGSAEDVSTLTAQRYTSETTEAGNVELTAKSLVKVINRGASSEFYAEYLSTENDAPGKVRIWSRSLDQAQFNIQSDGSALGSSFSPDLPIGVSTLVSDNSVEESGSSRSKFERPEAVPALNTDTYGARNKAVLGAVALPEELVIFKEDGIYKVTGETDGSGGFSFVVDVVDPTILLEAPGSLLAFDNAAFGFTDQGLIRATGDNSQVQSWQIEEDMNRISLFSSFGDIARAVDYESDRKYILITPEASTDTRNKLLWVYNRVTRAWTVWRKEVSSGLVVGDKLYLLHARDAYVLQERKTISRSDSDHQDETLDCTVTAVGTTTDANGDTVATVTVTQSYHMQPTDGWALRQGTIEGDVRSVAFVSNDKYTLTLATNTTFAVAAATLTLPVDFRLEWAPEEAGNFDMLKKFTEIAIYFQNDHGSVNKIGFHSDVQRDEDFNSNMLITRKDGWGLNGWGATPWGDAQGPTGSLITTRVHRDHVWCTALRALYRHRVAKERVEVLGMALNYNEAGRRVRRTPV